MSINLKFKGLYRRFHYLYNQEFIDQDYHKKLSDEDAEWLANFNDNYYGGRFRTDESKNPIKDPEERRQIWKDARARRRDQFANRRYSQVDFEKVSTLDWLIDLRLLKNKLATLSILDQEYAQYYELIQELESRSKNPEDEKISGGGLNG